MDSEALKHILEASLLVAGRALSVAQLDALFEDDADRPDRKALRAALESLQQDYEGRGIELVEVASGFRLQSRAAMEPWIGRLFPERAPRYSRALLETLVLIAYRQPITRGEIEEVRGVAVSSTIVKTLQEREWVKVIGHKEVPGRPALLATTREFLDYFNLKRLEDLPPLSELKDLDQFDSRLAEEIGVVSPGMQGDAANDGAEVHHGPPAPAWARQASSVATSAPAPEAATRTETEADVGTLATGDVDDFSPARSRPHQETEPVAGNSQAQTELQRVIANFALEHRQQLDQQRAASGETQAAEIIVDEPAGDGDDDDASLSAGIHSDEVASDQHPAEPIDGNSQAVEEEVDSAGSDSADDTSDAGHADGHEETDSQATNGRHNADRPEPGDNLH